MKTRRHIFSGLMLAAAALLCCTGCKKEDEGEKVVLGVDFEQTAGMQKTYIGNGDRTVCWSEGDKVNVNGTAYEVGDGSVEVTLNDDGYAAVYPADAVLNGIGKDCSGGTVEIPATQPYTLVDGKQQLNAPMAGRLDSRTGRLQFRNLYSVIRVTVKARSDRDFRLKNICITAANGNLSGTQGFRFDGATDNVKNLALETPAGGTPSVILTGIDSLIPAGDSAFFYLYTLTISGETLTLTLNGSLYEEKSKPDGISIARSVMGRTTLDLQNMDYGIGKFSVTAGGKQVAFSPGNLQWSATGGGSTPTTHDVAGGGTADGTWRFAEHQYDFIGNNAGNTTKMANGRATQSAWIDLFRWGTSGWNNGNVLYRPYDYGGISEYPAEKGHGYGPTDGSTYTNDLTGVYANSDWGVYNKIGSDPSAGIWRTLTREEWAYMLGTSGSTRGGVNSTWWIYNMVTIKKADGTHDVNGLIIYSDGVTAQPDGLSVSLTRNSITAKEITLSDFAVLEAAGCAFLPCAGYDVNTPGAGSVNTIGHYWTSTHATANKYEAYYINVTTAANTFYCCYHGNSVRLAKDIE